MKSALILLTLQAMLPIQPGTSSDVMGYCASYWVGAYDWGKVASFFSSGPAPNAVNGPNAVRRIADAPTPTIAPHVYLQKLKDTELTLHVHVLTHDPMRITDSFTNYGSYFHESPPGPVRFDGLRKDGSVLFTQMVALAVVHRGDQDGSAPLDRELTPGEASQLAGLRVTYNGKIATRTALPYSPPKGRAVVENSNYLQFTFDGTRFGSVTVRPSLADSDETTIESDGTSKTVGDVNLSTPNVYVDFTDGISTTARKVKFHVEGR